MDTPKLSDFTKSELQSLLNVVVAKIVDEDTHRKEWLKYFRRLGGYHEFQSERLSEYNNLCLWRVQILNAISKVTISEEINSN